MSMVNFDQSKEDVLVWELNSNGKFSSSSDWNAIRDKGNIFQWHNFLWNKYIPPKLSMHFWRKCHSVIAIDSEV